MTFAEKITKVAELINNNEKARKFFEENCKYIGTTFTSEQFYDLMLHYNFD